MKPLRIPKAHWRSRWLVLESWNRLHRIAKIEWEQEEGDMIVGHGIACCGAKGRFSMPGVFSRMGLARCKHCCRIAGVPEGEGAPENKGIAEGS